MHVYIQFLPVCPRAVKPRDTSWLASLQFLALARGYIRI